MMMIDVNGMQISLDEKTLSLSVKKGNQIWKFREDAKLQHGMRRSDCVF